MKLNKMSDKMYFFETESKENKRYYGYIFKHKANAKKIGWKIKCVLKSPHNVKSIYLETFKRESFNTIKECKKFLENL